MPPHSSAVPGRSLEGWNVWALTITMVAAVMMVTPTLAIPLGITKTFILAAGAVVTLVLFIIARLSRGTVIFPPLMLVGALWLPAVAYALSAAFSGAPFAQALWGSALEADTLGLMLTVACLGTLTALTLRRAEHYQGFLRASSALFVVLVVLQVLILGVGQVAPGTLSPAFSLLGSYQDLAFVLGLGVIGALITLRFITLAERPRRILVLVTILALALLAVANVPLVWMLVALVALGLFIEAAMMRRHVPEDADLDEIAFVQEDTLTAPSGGHSIALSLPVLAVALFFLVGGTLGGALAQALHVDVVSVSPSWQSTLAIARQTYGTAPLFGTGPGSFGVEWLKHRDPSLNTTIFWNTDFTSGIGVVPTSIVTTGALGALAWLVLFALCIGMGLRMLVTRTPQDPFVRYVATLSFVASAYLFAVAIFALPGVVVFTLAFVFGGLLASTTRFATGARQRGIIFSRSPRVGFVIVFLLTLLMFGAIAVGYTLVERYVSLVALTRAQSAFASGDLAAADTEVQNSLTFAPSSAAYQAQANIAIVRLGQIAASTTMPVNAAQQAFQNTLSTGINAAITATRLAPSEYRNWIALGNLYAQAVPLGVTGAYDSAKTAYQKAQVLNPTSPEILYILAQLDIAHKDSKAAQENLKAAIALKQDYTNAIFLLSQLQVQDGNVKAALDSSLAAAYFAPNDPTLLFQVGVLRAASADYPGAIQALATAVSANPSFANARYFLAAVYAKQKDLPKAIEQLEALAALSPENAEAVAPLVTALQAGKNPFPANLLTIAPPTEN